MNDKSLVGVKGALLGMDSKARLYLYLAGAALILIVLAGFTMIYLSRSELEDCIRSGMNARNFKKSDNIWEKMENETFGTTPASIEYDIRIQCMKAMHGK